MRRAAAACAFALYAFALARGEPGPATGAADVEPLRLHRAVIRNEARLNVEHLSKPRLGGRGIADENRATLELAWGSMDGLWGAEAFVPHVDPDGNRGAGPGDIEIQPLKRRLSGDGDVTASVALGVRLDTGDEGDLNGVGYRALLPRFALEGGRGAWLGGLNVAPEIRVSGEAGGRAGLGGFVAWDPFARPELPRWLPAVSAELLGVHGYYGDDRRQDRWEVLPGLHFRLPWGIQARIGWDLPLTTDRERDASLLLQVGVAGF